MPTARSNAMAGLVEVGALEDGMIAVFGGYDGLTSLAVTELYDPVLDLWSAGPPMLVDTSEQAVGMTHDSTGIYSIGRGIFGVDGVDVERLVLVPEPATIFVMTAAGLPVLLRRRRRRSRNPVASACRELVEPGLALGGVALLRRRRK